MSTWNDKPNDYEHALAEIGRLQEHEPKLRAAQKGGFSGMTQDYICRSCEKREQLEAEIARLRAVLFRVQCEQLERATNADLSAQRHRRLAMATRDRIITILANE